MVPPVTVRKAFSAEEIWGTIRSCDGNKAPGRDWLHIVSIRKGWKLMKEDVLKFFAEFHRNGRQRGSTPHLLPKEMEELEALQAVLQNAILSCSSPIQIQSAGPPIKKICKNQSVPVLDLGKPLASRALAIARVSGTVAFPKVHGSDDGVGGGKGLVEN
ncbi:hypothetical protein RHGRI_020052 [Rhododendron griersonianum]|uniref:Uncharacterized protein n=1 Tax=Rhododendron griersonianum TaxID=479676 RepID=A0AAV6JI13_9ERIC|nr:hypothetical protein RHGRI_020052 [Rhododendron griersonianum]